MGWLFHTPSDDATEATLQALHWQNTLDNYYERGWGWLRTLFFTTVAVFATSYYEKVVDASVWDSTIEWFIQYAQDKVNGWT